MLASIGRTLFASSYFALHWMLGSGQACTCTAGQAGQGLASGHFRVGQRGRGQGGHSPILQGLLQVLMQGGQAGTDVLRTYLLISGWGGHSVFNMYLDISGSGGHGGTVAFRTHLLGSGSGHRSLMYSTSLGESWYPSPYPTVLPRFRPMAYPTKISRIAAKRSTPGETFFILLFCTYNKFPLYWSSGLYLGHPNISGYQDPHVSPRRLHTMA